MSRRELYRIALDTRNLEISLFWQRCNYFLLLNSALAVAYIQLKDEHLIVPVTLLGLLVCVLWYRVALGSKYWQERWEAKLHALEIDYRRNGYFPHDLALFSAPWQEIQSDVAKSLGSTPRSPFEQFIGRQILRKPSVTQSMIYLVLAFIAGWVLVFLYQFYRLLVNIAFA